MQFDNLVDELDYLFSEVFDIIVNQEEANLKEKGLTNVTLKELHLICKIDDLNKRGLVADPKRLLKELRITKGTLSVATTRLTNKELLKKIQIGGDKRRIAFEVTDKSDFIIDLHHKWHHRLIQVATHAMSEQEAIALNKALKNIKGAIDAEGE